ncbi:hypothetical protein MGALJ_53440 [Mycobacterium gallinarum]|uniref:Uncharacterized protein n=1 Tax=Mycobacterium gallinarum TaxID=39689 RepID=A0A9W4BD41_9MYCO|nr:MULTISPECIES: hypothetical protein [Mycobacterium]MDV3135698.1 hypothetical protein [Mycobacterium sp. 29Ha]BBY95675.1 hypothetical protein MGALJ_53440 [Mycobacterium gallinarum]
MKPVELERFLKPTLSNAGFTLDEVQEPIVHGNRPAWAVYYRRSDCKLQVCWSARDGGIDFMLALPDAPNEFGLTNDSKEWHFMLLLSDAEDNLETPGLGAQDDTILTWLQSLFDIHFEPAHRALLQRRARE